MKQHFDTLGIPNTYISYNELKSVYNKLIKKVHPDYNNSKDASDIFRKIHEAYLKIKESITLDTKENVSQNNYNEEDISSILDNHPFLWTDVSFMRTNNGWVTSGLRNTALITKQNNDYFVFIYQNKKQLAFKCNKITTAFDFIQSKLKNDKCNMLSKNYKWKYEEPSEKQLGIANLPEEDIQYMKSIGIFTRGHIGNILGYKLRL